MEHDFTDAPPDRRRIGRDLFDSIRRQLDDDQVVGEAAANHRPQGRIAAVAAVPVVLAVKLHRGEEIRKGRGGEQCLERHLVIGDDARQAGPDIGDGDEQCRRQGAVYRIDVNVRGDRLAQRMDAERGRAVQRRQSARHQPIAHRIAPLTFQRTPE